MQFFKYNRPAAVAALAVIVILSILLGVNRSVSSLAGKVEHSYTDTKVQSDLSKYVTHARSFAAAAEALYGDNDSLRTAIDALDAALASPLWEMHWLKGVEEAAAAVYYNLQLDGAADEDVKRSATAYYYEMQSTVQRLANNTDYQKRAVAYNKAIRAFPASLLAPGRRDAVVFS